MEYVASNKFADCHCQVDEQADSSDTDSGIFFVRGCQVDVVVMVVVVVAVASGLDSHRGSDSQCRPGGSGRPNKRRRKRVLYIREMLSYSRGTISKQTAMCRECRVSSESCKDVALLQLAAASQRRQETHQGPLRSRILAYVSASAYGHAPSKLTRPATV